MPNRLHYFRIAISLYLILEFISLFHIAFMTKGLQIKGIDIIAQKTIRIIMVNHVEFLVNSTLTFYEKSLIMSRGFEQEWRATRPHARERRGSNSDK